MTGKAYWQKLEKIGWIDYIPKERREESRSQLEKNLGGEVPEWAFLALTQAGFDSETIDGIGPDELSYHSILKELAKDSNGVFRPTNIKDELVDRGKSIKVTFRHTGKTFSCTVPFESDYFQLGVLDLVNEALESCQAQERFIPLPAVDQMLNLVFVPPGIYQKAVAQKLIPEQDAFAEGVEE